MVDAVVSVAVQKLGEFLIQEVNQHLCLKAEVQWLQNDLLYMQSFLKDAEERQVGDHRVRQWVFDIKSVANDAVAILETYSLEAGEGDDDGFASRLKACACACICRKEVKSYKVSKQIQSLKKRLKDISHKRQTYDIRSIDTIPGEGPSNQPNNRSAMVRTLTSYVDDQDQIFVGFQDVVEGLLAEILKAEPHRRVISIYGMGGLGKTTLAKKLYHSPDIVSSFQKRTWMCVSQEYNTMDLLMHIIKSIQGSDRETVDPSEKKTEIDLVRDLQNLLKGEKYLVVVDDLWHRKDWQRLNIAFPDSKNGSRIIITTRNHDVAERADNKGFVHKLRDLNQEESWDLFCKKLLDVQVMVPTMKKLAKDMVDKCGGLPLAIVVLSGLLSHKRGIEQWQKVKDHLWKNIKRDSEKDSVPISYILLLSYNDLPTELKNCFLYFGIFPEDHVIPAEDITRLWLAEGFIPRGEERMEDVAEGFLNELIRRSLVQVADTLWEEVTECRIHDLLRDLAVEKASEVNLFGIYDQRNPSIVPLGLRHVIHGQAQGYLSLDLSTLKLRSVLFFDFYKLSLIKFRNQFQHIYVLYLDSDLGSTYELADAIGSLNHLKFLRLRNIPVLPSSIGNLKNLLTLQALDKRYHNVCRLAPEIANLVNLRHLVVRYSEPLQHINKLTSLQVLRDIYCDQWKDVDPVDLVDLRELRMYRIEKSYSLNNISSLKSLSTLKLVGSFPALEFLSSCQKLQKLDLFGEIEKLPSFPNSITMMNLGGSYLMEDPMPILGMLPNLRDLKLRYEAYSGKEITCSDNSFSQLEFLHLGQLKKLERWDLGTSAMPLIKGLSITMCPKLERWDLGTSAMPLIKGLRIDECPKLKEIPERMKDVERLKEI